MALAWRTAAFATAAFVGKLAPLDQILARGKGQGPQPQTRAHWGLTMQLISDRFGIPLERRPRLH